MNLALIPKVAGVYALHLNGEVVYVGQTENLRQRMRAHAINKTFDHTPPVITRATTVGESVIPAYRLHARAD